MARNYKTEFRFPDDVALIGGFFRGQQLKEEVISQLVPLAVMLDGKRVVAERKALQKIMNDKVREAMIVRARNVHIPERGPRGQSIVAKTGPRGNLSGC